MSGGDIRTAKQARQVLNLPQDAGLDELRRAFRAAVRKAHPDRGGSADALRRVIDANRLLTRLHDARLNLTPARIARPQAPAQPAAKPPAPHAWPLEITVAEAMCGGDRKIRLPDGRKGALKLSAGLRPGDLVRLKAGGAAMMFKITYAAGAYEVRGNDVWMTATVPPRLLDAGGRIEIDAPGGRKSVAVAAGTRTVRLQGQGLPARGSRGQGHLIVRLVPERTAGRSCASDLLRRFTASWAA